MRGFRLLAVIAVPFALASAAHGGALKERADRQENRIRDGVQDGSVTNHEAKALRGEQEEIREDLRAAKKDGKVTRPEARHIHREQNRASRHIARDKNE